MPEETVGAADLAMCECEPCKRKAGKPHGVVAGLIHEYTSTPRNGWRPRYTRDELAQPAMPPTFGIELETQAPERYITDLADRPYVPYLRGGATAEEAAEHDRLVHERDAWDVRNARHRERQRERAQRQGNMTAEEAVSMAAPRGLWHAKHDGSVSGPEFASQPASLAYWRTQQGHLASMFKSLLHGGMRSHDGDTCGFHVNIGTDAFHGPDGRPDAAHLERFATLICMNPRWSVRMSQRTHRSSQWARFGSLERPEQRRAWADTMHRNGYCYTDHTSVLNTSHVGRVEFRLPRGTLRIDRFYAKLEWAAAMVEYTRDTRNVVQPSAFMRWVKAQGERYAMLVAYMTERFNAARFEGEDSPAAVIAERPAVTASSVITDDELTAEWDARFDGPYPPVICESSGWGMGSWVCERPQGHDGVHAAPSVRNRSSFSWREQDAVPA